MKLVSACLLGIKCAWDGKDRYKNDRVIELSKKEILIPICPEQLGGQSTPRPAAEIKNGDGLDVLNGKSKVMEPGGKDVTKFFIDGAEEVLKLANLFDIKEAILKQKSPSCGCGKIYDGTFSRSLINGDGVTTALLKRNNIKVMTEEDLKE